MNDTQKELADTIINYFKEHNGIPVRLTDLEQALYKQVNGVSPQNVRYVIEMLVHKDLLHKIVPQTLFTDSETYYLTSKGWIYESYDELLKDEQQKEDLNQQLIKSAITTNHSITTVNKLFWATLAFTIVSALSTCGNLILELYKLRKTPLTETQSLHIQRKQQGKDEKQNPSDSAINSTNVSPPKDTLKHK